MAISSIIAADTSAFLCGRVHSLISNILFSFHFFLLLSFISRLPNLRRAKGSVDVIYCVFHNTMGLLLPMHQCNIGLRNRCSCLGSCRLVAHYFNYSKYLLFVYLKTVFETCPVVQESYPMNHAVHRV